ncbi:hypothetical protein [Bradyrhizobium sp. RD5-C2]|uniref:hypothetical protein n=1 Tax=Bradyrhizobium sp. RD5-C2 TaxID=244562 RepID=UPI001CC70A04|nr:hypothetical protein [Bradyrhizobium sp. RD5-C2]
MKKTMKVQPKKRGRPDTGKDPLMGFRASPEMRASAVRWAEYQPGTPSLSEAIRRLVELGLTVRTNPLTDEREDQQRREHPKQRARELASNAIDKVTDPAASPDDQASRKRRLIKGPGEFQKVRRDRKRK